MRIGKQTVLFIFSFFHILVLYPNDSTAHDDNSSLLSLRDFLFFERVTAGLRDVHDWAKKHEQLNSQGYKDFVSKYYNDIARHCAFDEIKEHMFADLTTQLQIPDIRSSPVESQNIVSAKSPSAQITSPPTSQLNDQQYSFGVDTELVLDISDRRHPSEYARMTPYDISIQNKLHQCAAIFNNVCRYSYARVKRLEHENKNIDFSAMQSKLPHGFKQSFEKRGLYERCFGERVGQSEYEKAFYYDLVETYGQDFTHEQSVQHQYAQMHRWKEYHNEEFRKFLQTFALYNDYVIEIDKHFKTCAGRCFKKAHACETKAYHCIAHQAEALHKKYEHAKKQAQKLRAYNAHQRHLCMQEIFTSQIPDLDAVALEWQETHPERAQAYNETIEDPQKLKKQQYALSWHAARCLSLQGFDPADYQELYGNPLQHELFRELLDGVEFLAQLPQVDRAKPFDVMARTATLETFADARQINAMGDCVGASKLIDFGVSLLEYCAAAVGGFGSGVWKGIKKTGTDIAHIAYHPDRVVMALGLVVVHFADLIYNYVPFDDVMSTTFDEQDCERIAKNWAKESNKAVNWWKKTPAHDKMHQVVEVPVGFLTNAILFGCCASFASKLAT
ncbi:MAG TPA: hypothetical protein VGT41_00145, partial [Candidatus Babeliales bacterium]|nr:hypothetical protein [Candidatus Babeliales bacterium]